jgi:hypothetical protein
VTPLGLIAGAGALPRRILRDQAERGRPVFVLALEGHTDPETVAGVPHVWHRLGAAGAILASLQAAGVRDLVMAGKVERPSLLSLAPDAEGAAILARIGWRALGDDGLLRAVAGELAARGFRLAPVPEVLSNATAPAGVWGRVAPDATARADIARGFAVAHALGLVDVGQAVVVQQGIVLGVEAIEGTDALIARAADLARPGPRPVLVKRAKPNQDVALDLPVVGPVTIAAVIAAQFAGIALEADRVLVLDRTELVASADAAGLFLLAEPLP